MGELEQCKSVVENSDGKGKFEGKSDGLFSDAATNACRDRAWQKGKDLIWDVSPKKTDIVASLKGMEDPKAQQLAAYLWKNLMK